jgi:Cellulase (glycosyl hydrolase family 5)/Glycoside hydrolase family 5 C-terminal domain
LQFIPPRTQDIRSEDSWFRHADGRWLLLRGVAFGPSAKLEPHLPFRSPEDWVKYEMYLDLLLACGFTTLRIPFFWSAFEPHCNPVQPEYEEGYLRDFFHYVHLFAAKGFLILIDLHQDLLGKAFGGNGMPDWVHSEGTRKFSFLMDTPLWGANYQFNRHLRKTFTDFWNNDLTNRSIDPPLEHFPVRDRFLDMMERVAKAASECDRVLGIEIFNEPHPARHNSRAFEENILPEFYTDAIRRIRKHSKSLFAFLAPQSDWNVNLRSNRAYDSFLPAAVQDDRVVFAFHYYDSLLTALGGRWFHDAKREEYLDAQRHGARLAREKRMVPFLTEFGSRQNWARTVVRHHMEWQFESVEQALVNATYWNVNLYNTLERNDGFMREDFSLIGTIPESVGTGIVGDAGKELRNLDVTVRPYVMAASAEPVHQHFNLRSKVFELVLQGKTVDAPTVIYVPAVAQHPWQPVQYATGCEVLYNGRILEGWTMEENRLSLQLDPTVDLHSITIRLAS